MVPHCEPNLKKSTGMSKKEEPKQIDTGAKKDAEDKKDEKDNVLRDDKGVPLTESDIALFNRYGRGPYTD